MTSEVFLFIIMILCLSALVFYLFGRKHQSSKQMRQRKGDVRRFTPAEKKILKQADSLRSQGAVVQSARLLESIHCHREAINMLEKAGKIQEAANTLVRMGLFGRAGFLFFRHRQWEKAIECFKKANMPLEIANCAIELGDFGFAAENFTKAGKFEEAAEVYGKMGDHPRAADRYAKASKPKEVIEQFQLAIQSGQKIVKANLDRRAVDIIGNYLAEGNADLDLGRIINNEPLLFNVVLTLAQNKKHDVAISLLACFNQDPSPQLLEALDYDNVAMAQGLIEIFTNVGQYNFAAMILEKSESFALAAPLFEKGGDFLRAIECYRKCGNHAKAEELRRNPQQQEVGKIVNLNWSQNSGVFSMNKLETLAGEQLSGALQAASGSDSKSLPFDGRALVEPLPFPSQQGKPDAETLKILSKVTLLQGLDDELLAKIWSSGEIINFEAKQTIINFIENPVGLYLIISGVVRCFRISSNDEHNDNHLGSGKTFGEPWTLSDQIARARFVAEETSKILLIKKERCQELFGREPAIGRTVYKAFSRRLMQHLSGGGSADSFDRVFGL